ncbi:phage baseplate assembly protein V [Cytophagaceae bacterium ABcell3]|nr:phage baseplate assembly protein V [Cytophagaceae bacterium ABcell3]
MSREIKYEIVIDGKAIVHFNSLTIRQAFNSHHVFELVVDQDTLQEPGAHTILDARDYIGNFLTVCFGDKDADDNVFKGLITEVSMLQEEGLWGNIMLKGYSPTWLMESGAHHTSFEDITLKKALEEAMKDVAGNDMEVIAKPAFAGAIPYVCQYGESRFSFINRLACEYGEWFFYDGYKLYLGKPASPENTDLIYGEHISRMSFSMKMVPSTISHYSYHSKDDNVMTGNLPGQVDSGSYTRKALETSDSFYRNPVSQPVKTRVSTQSDLDRYAKIHKKKFAASAVILEGEGDCPKIKVGHMVTVKVSKKGLGIGYEDHGEYTVTSLVHHLSGTGAYSNSFEAIPSDNEVMPFNAEKPLAESQIAFVKDNNDPDGLGRVRVQMLWQQAENKTTDWIRVMSPDAGASDKVGTNRGFVFIPEVGDQVVVSFRYNDPDRPFVLGSMFHGKNASGGGDGNNVKSLTTKSGCTVTLDDAKESVTISDPGGSTIVLNGDGSMTISAPDKIDIQSKEINIVAEKQVSIEGKNKVEVGSQEVAIDGTTKTTVNSSSKVEIGAASVEVEGKAQLKLQSAMVDMDGTAMTNVKGGLLNLN